MNPSQVAETAGGIARDAASLAERAQALAAQAAGATAGAGEMIEPFLFLLSIFLLACFVGYYVVWNVTPSPLSSSSAPCSRWAWPMTRWRGSSASSRCCLPR